MVLFVAAFVAGGINSIAGGGTLITFPALLWLGIDAKVANATSTVVLGPVCSAVLYGYRKELKNSGVSVETGQHQRADRRCVGAWLLIVILA